ncbi:MAG: hypothetical protein ACM3QX_18335 [Syntrophomonadaceae bacterium]
MRAEFMLFTIEMTRKQAEYTAHRGECLPQVQELLQDSKIKRQLKKISDDDLKEELDQYGAWSDEELSDRADNEERIIWLAAGHILDQIEDPDYHFSAGGK